jgi:hypothetical protein
MIYYSIWEIDLGKCQRTLKFSQKEKENEKVKVEVNVALRLLLK